MGFFDLEARIKELEHQTEKCIESSSHYHVMQTKITFISEALTNKIEQDKKDKEEQCKGYQELLTQLNELNTDIKVQQEKITSSDNKVHQDLMNQCRASFATKNELKSEVDRLTSSAMIIKSALIAVISLFAWLYSNVPFMHGKS